MRELSLSDALPIVAKKGDDLGRTLVDSFKLFYTAGLALKSAEEIIRRVPTTDGQSTENVKAAEEWIRRYA